VVNNLIDISHLHAHGDWYLVWSLEVPPVVKIFIWWMLRDCLPTRSKLITKKVQHALKLILDVMDITKKVQRLYIYI
jgi:hypothetical protein